jgi:glycosyltransferase involved in cell wall biosynthesis
MPRLSLIIPTRDRADTLGDLLHTVQRQETDSRALEVVVVDDGSAQELAPLVARSEGPMALRCVRQDAGGLNAARNRGIDETSGELLAFLDDDTLLTPNWSDAIISSFDDPACAGLAGRVALRFEAPPPKWLSRRQRSYLAELDLGPRALWLDNGPVPVGANCAVRRTELERVGGFRVGLDRFGSSLISNGDTEFFRRLRAQGGRLRYEPAAQVLHRVPAERLTREFFRRRAYAQGVSDALLAALGEPEPRALRVARELCRYGRTAPILARGILTGHGSMNAVQWASYCHGRFGATAHGNN